MQMKFIKPFLFLSTDTNIPISQTLTFNNLMIANAAKAVQHANLRLNLFAFFYDFFLFQTRRRRSTRDSRVSKLNACGKGVTRS